MVRTRLLLFFILITSFPAARGQTSPSSSSVPARIPVIFDTDIGDDIDDSYALVELLRSPQFDIKLITTTHGETEYRARLIAKYLTLAGRTDIPIGLGPDSGPYSAETMAKWTADFPLSSYTGKIEKDGVQAMIDTINQSPLPVTVIAVGPMTTLGAALRKDPGIAAKANLVGMDGSIHKGYGGSPKPAPEFNVYASIPDAKLVFSAPWKSIVITPLDTCGLVAIGGDLFQKLHESPDPLVKGLLESHMAHNNLTDPATLKNSGTCFDTVAVYLADPRNWGKFQMDELKITVTDTGLTSISPTGRQMQVATAWIDKDGFILDLGERILGKP